jgi:hypothetical protein
MSIGNESFLFYFAIRNSNISFTPSPSSPLSILIPFSFFRQSRLSDCTGNHTSCPDLFIFRLFLHAKLNLESMKIEHLI